MYYVIHILLIIQIIKNFLFLIIQSHHFSFHLKSIINPTMIILNLIIQNNPICH